jgi:hypothetical protein
MILLISQRSKRTRMVKINPGLIGGEDLCWIAAYGEGPDILQNTIDNRLGDLRELITRLDTAIRRSR